MAVSAELRDKREHTVRQHMELENRHEYEATIDTFEHPRYELIGTGDIYDGRAEVARYFDETRTAFPDQENELIAIPCRSRAGGDRVQPPTDDRAGARPTADATLSAT